MNVTEAFVDQALITFSWFDYGLFGAMLLLSVLIGLYFGCWGHQDSANEYLLGGKEMTVVPIAVSLVASNISGITLLGLPTDIYRFGSTLYLYVAALVPVYLITYYVYLPVFHKLQLISVYEYMMLRFNRKIRLIASGLATVSNLLYLPIVVYIPALALTQATQISLHLVTPVLCGVCIFYTTIGGLKAVVWTDTLQFFVMMGSILAVFYMGLESVGGFGNVWQRAVNGGRLDFDLDPDLTKRDTVVAICVGTLFGSISYMSISQSFVQKYLSMPTLKHSKRALLIFLVGMFIIYTLVVVTGLIMYARYHECDPYTAGKISKHDQVLPYYVMDVASTIPGLAGLFLSGIFSAALSTLSACMNCLSGSIYEDFVSPYMPKDISQKQVSNVLKLLVVIIGIISTAMVFVIEQMGSILPVNYALSGMTSGPLLGLFTLGMLFPVANSKGAIFGSFGGIACMAFIIIGSQYHQVMNDYAGKPVSIEGCTNSTLLIPNLPKPSVDKSDVFVLFRITHYYYTCLGTLLTVLFGVIVSCWTQGPKDPEVNSDLISPVSKWVINKFRRSKTKKAEYYDVNKAFNITITEKQ